MIKGGKVMRKNTKALIMAACICAGCAGGMNVMPESVQAVNIPVQSNKNASSQYADPFIVEIVKEPDDKLVHINGEPDFTGMLLDVWEVDWDGNVVCNMKSVTLDDVREMYEVSYHYYSIGGGEGTCIINITDDVLGYSSGIGYLIKMGGDVNCDGFTNISDAVMLSKWLMNDPEAYLIIWENADLNRDGRLNVFDYTELLDELSNSSAQN